MFIIAYQWSNMGNRGFLHTTPVPTMLTILLSSIKISLPADPVAVLPLRPGKFHIHLLLFSLVFIVLLPVFCSQIWTISSSWLEPCSWLAYYDENPIFKIDTYKIIGNGAVITWPSLQLIISTSNQKLHEYDTTW